MKKLLSVLLIISSLLIMNFAFAADPDDVEPYSSYYLDHCAILLSADGNGEMSVDFYVAATKRMTKVGVSSISLEEERAPDVWRKVRTVFGSSDPDRFYSSKAYEHSGEYTFKNLTPGVNYRATVVGYASDSNGSDTSSATSYSETCK